MPDTLNVEENSPFAAPSVPVNVGLPARAGAPVPVLNDGQPADYLCFGLVGKFFRHHRRLGVGLDLLLVIV